MHINLFDEQKMNYYACPICRSPCRTISPEGFQKVDCPRCGTYKIGHTPLALLEAQDIPKEIRWNISSYIHSLKEYTLKAETIEDLKEVHPPRVSERAESLLHHLTRQYPVPGTKIKIHPGNMIYIFEVLSKQEEPEYIESLKVPLEIFYEYLPILSAGWITSLKELIFFLTEYLTSDLGYLEKRENNEYFISARGWDYVQNTQKANDSNSIFVAMSFSSDLEDFYLNLVEKGIKKAGYDPIRVDRTEHVNRIDDEIIALIKRSKMVVADFTEQKNGVYFEAGFGLGLGIPIIWMCRHDDLKRVHFDTRQYNTIELGSRRL